MRPAWPLHGARTHVLEMCGQEGERVRFVWAIDERDEEETREGEEIRLISGMEERTWKEELIELMV